MAGTFFGDIDPLSEVTSETRVIGQNGTGISGERGRTTVGDLSRDTVRLARSLAANPDSADASLLADFGRKGYGVGDDEGINKAVSFAELFTFSRASDKTAIDNASGLLVTVPANEPAFSWSSVFGGRKPLTIHEARTNLLTYSQEFDAASWSKPSSTVIANTDVAPDGSTTADLAECTLNGGGVFKITSVTAGLVYTFSFYAKKPNTSTAAAYRIFDATNGISIIGVTSYFSSINESGFTRISVTFTIPAGCSSIRCYPLADSGLVTIWGAQLELGSFATPYIPTVATTATRAADICTIDDLSGWFNPVEGTFVVEVERNLVKTNATAFGIGDGTNSNKIEIRASTSHLGLTRINVAIGGVFYDVASIIPTNETHIKIAVSYKAGRIATSANGSAVTSIAQTMNTNLFNQARIGAGYFGSPSTLDGSINFLDYKDFAATDEQLQEWSTL